MPAEVQPFEETMPPTRVWIAQVDISARVEAKLRSKHGVTPDQVRETCLFFRYRQARWHSDPARGDRLIVTGLDRDGVLLRVLLKPAELDEGRFRCVTAIRVRM